MNRRSFFGALCAAPLCLLARKPELPKWPGPLLPLPEFAPGAFVWCGADMRFERERIEAVRLASHSPFTQDA